MSTVAVSTPASGPRSNSLAPRGATPAPQGGGQPRRPFRGKPGRDGAAGAKGDASEPRPEPRILFQSYFKSVGPRTYAAQVKEAGNGNPFIVLTEGKRDDATGEVRKTRVFVFSEDFPAFFRLIKETAEWVKAHPVSDEVKQKRERYWAKQRSRAQDAARHEQGNPAVARTTTPASATRAR